VTIHLPRGWYFFFLALIVLGEFALNSQAFDVFGKAPWLTWLMALTVAVGIPAVAHFMGIWTKQWPKPHWRTIAYIAICVVILAGCLLGINIARIKYLEAQNIHIVADEQILQKAFLYINFFIFLAATLMSHFAHDQDQELENLQKRVKRSARILERLDHAIHAFGGRIDAVFTEQSAKIGEAQAVIRELVHLYRAHNVRARREPRPPVVFAKDVEVAIPDKIVERQAPTDESKVEAIRVQIQEAQSSLATPPAQRIIT
jgi:hypothetical protein